MNADRINELYAREIFSPEVQSTARERIHWICRQARGKRILDIGCSQGIVCLLLAREGFNCVGIDYEKTAIAYALEELKKEEDIVRKRVEFKIGDAVHLSFEDDSFDTVILGEILEHLNHPEKVLKEAKRVLKDGGMAIITVPFGLSPNHDHKRTYYPVPFLETVQPFFKTDMIDTIDNYLAYHGIKDASYNISKVPKEDLLFEKLRLQRNTEERALSKEQELFDKANQLYDKIRTLNERVSGLSKRNKELNEALSIKGHEFEAKLRKKDIEHKEAVSAKESEIKGLQASKVKESENRGREFEAKLREKDIEHKEAVSAKESEIKGLQASKVKELEDREREFEAKLRKKDIEHKEAVSAKESEIKGLQASKVKESEDREREFEAKLREQEAQFRRNVSCQEQLYMHAWKWRIGSVFVDGYILVRDCIKHPVQFIKHAGSRFREYYNNINPPIASRENNLVKIDTGFVARTKQDQTLEGQDQRVALGCIFDEFTAACFQPECRMITFRPDNWKEILERDRPQAIFVESAWRGNDGSWQYRVAKYQKNMGNELIDVLAWAKEKKIPSFFWNKEDPVHFDRFIEKAGYFDHIFTSDADCIPKYRERLGHDHVYSLPFAAQPTIHNPILEHPRDGAVCFAGTYYCDRHEERRGDMEHILKPALSFGLEIYDRQYGLTGKQAELFRFPDIYQSSIKGRLDYDDMVKAYKRYKVFLNVNSVKTSPTMFSRRVYELLACGTPVISTYSKGIEYLLGDDIVFVSESEEDTRKHLEHLLSNGDVWMKASVKGIRQVMEKHTYVHRIRYIFDKVGIKSSENGFTQLTLLVKVSSAPEIDRLAAVLNEQTYRRFDLVVFSDFPHSGRSLERMRNALKDVRITNVPLQSRDLYAQCIQPSNSEYFAILDMGDHYGSNYLKDFALATMYSGSDFLGKHSYLSSSQKSERVENNSMGYEFRYVRSVPTATLVFKKGALTRETFVKCLRNRVFRSDDREILSIDRFNYIQGSFDERSSVRLTENLKRSAEV